jgi:hypothetical protein
MFIYMADVFTTTIGSDQGCTYLNGIIQMHYGTSAPAVTWPFQNWADTGSNPKVWKQRNEADSDWIVRGILNAENFGFTPLTTFNTHTSSFNTYTNSGWTPITATCTYVSADNPVYVFNITGDYTSILTAGNRFRCTQATGGQKDFIIHGVGAYADGVTPITIFGGTGTGSSDLVNETITNPQFSMMKSPQGFNLDPDLWSVILIDSSTRTQATPTTLVWYNLGNLYIDIPIGRWSVSKQVVVEGIRGTGNVTEIRTALSTTNNGASDTGFMGYLSVESPLASTNQRAISGTIYRQKILNLTTKTRYYLNALSNGSSSVSISFLGGTVSTILKAVSSYL